MYNNSDAFRQKDPLQDPPGQQQPFDNKLHSYTYVPRNGGPGQTGPTGQQPGLEPVSQPAFMGVPPTQGLPPQFAARPSRWCFHSSPPALTRRYRCLASIRTILPRRCQWDTLGLTG